MSDDILTGIQIGLSLLGAVFFIVSLKKWEDYSSK